MFAGKCLLTDANCNPAKYFMHIFLEIDTLRLKRQAVNANTTIHIRLYIRGGCVLVNSYYNNETCKNHYLLNGCLVNAVCAKRASQNVILYL